jgi:UDP:flavonoid glycosyltransferase YjiC (YdhE family)
MYQDFLRRRMKMVDIIQTIQPDLIFIDAHIPLLYFLVFELAPCMMVNTTIETNKMPQIPPLSSGYIPVVNSRWSNFKVEIIWKKYFFRQVVNSIFQKVIYLGKDNKTFVRRLSIENSIPFKSILNTQRALKVGIKNTPEIIVAPIEFDYPWLSRNKEVLYTGPSVDLERKEDILSEDFGKIIDHLQKVKSTYNTSKIVYFSLGTINSHQNRNCIRFFKNVIKAFANREGWFLIMSVGKDVAKETLGTIPANVFVFNKLPQLAVLSISNIMITHGGFNSIKECVLKEVPIVVYPLSNIWDQQGNAARIVYHGIGKRGSIERDSPDDVFFKVKSVLDADSYKKNIAEISKLFRQYDQSDQVSDFVEKYLAKTAEAAVV